MKTIPTFENGQLILTADLRAVLNGDARVAIVNALAPRLGFTLVRAPQGLSICVTDMQSGTVMTLVSLKEVLRQSLEEGTLAENALDNLPLSEALERVRDGLKALSDQLDCQAEFLGGDAGFEFESLGTRNPSVEAEMERSIAAAG
jgi:hypothetical protein